MKHVHFLLVLAFQIIYLRSLYFLSAWESANLSKVDNEAMIRTDAMEFHILPKRERNTLSWHKIKTAILECQEDSSVDPKFFTLHIYHMHVKNSHEYVTFFKFINYKFIRISLVYMVNNKRCNKTFTNNKQMAVVQRLHWSVVKKTENWNDGKYLGDRLLCMYVCMTVLKTTAIKVQMTKIYILVFSL